MKNTATTAESTTESLLEERKEPFYALRNVIKQICRQFLKNVSATAW